MSTRPTAADIGIDLEPELALARRLAAVADALTLPFYESRAFTTGRKLDRSEVTEADKNCEAAIAEVVLAERPHHGMFGEEYGLVGNTESPWRWIVDPIDGTSNFVRRIPVWATLVALTHVEFGPVVGVVSAPAMNRRWWAATGLGAYADGRRLEVSTVDRLDEAQVCITYSPGWNALGLTGALTDLQVGAYRTRGFGDFWQHMLVAEGAIDLAVDAVGVMPYDLAAPMVIVEEAGGVFTDRHGERTYLHDSAVSSNGLLHHHAAPLA
jgi:histidinol-phosphatase